MSCWNFLLNKVNIVKSCHFILIMKEYKCPHCKITFSGGSSLRSHVRVVHEKKKAFKCPCCRKAFGQQSNLSIHMRSVHGKQRRYRCVQCNYSSYTASNMRRHRRTARHRQACVPIVHIPNITLEEANELLALLL